MKAREGPVGKFPSRVGITGSPGTGKKTIGAKLATLTGLELFSINDFAIASEAGAWRDGEFLVDTSMLKGKIATEGRIVVGHLLPYVLSNRMLDRVIVLRCSPSELKRRYMDRGYPEAKIRENVEAEMIGLIAGKCAEVFDHGKLAEFDTTQGNAQTIAKNIQRSLCSMKGRQFGRIDWLARVRTPSTLVSLVSHEEEENHRLNKTKKDN